MMFKLKTHKEYSALQADRDNLLAKVTELEAKVDTTKDYVALEADRNTIFNDREQLKEQVNNHKTAMDTLVSTHEAAMATLKADYDKTISSLQTELKKEAASSEAKAISTLAKIGVPMDEMPKATGVEVKEPKKKFQVISHLNKTGVTTTPQ